MEILENRAASKPRYSGGNTVGLGSSMRACHACDPGSNPGQGASFCRRSGGSVNGEPSIRKTRENAGSGFVFSEFSSQLEALAESLPQSKLEELKADLHRVYKRRFKVPKEPKYGSINKAFTETELQLFLRAVGSEKFRLLFEY